MKIFGIDVIFSAYITLHYKVLVVLLYLNHSKLGELSLLMSWSLMKSMFLLVNIKLFPRWSTVLSSFISLLKVFLSSSNPSRTDLYLQRDLIKLMASGWKMPSDDTATGRKLTPSLLNSAPTALSFLSNQILTRKVKGQRYLKYPSPGPRWIAFRQRKKSCSSHSSHHMATFQSRSPPEKQQI